MWSPKQRFTAIAGGAIAAAAMAGGVAFAQAPSGTPAPTTPGGPSATQPAPDNLAPGAKRDCPDKSGGQGAGSTGTATTPRY